MNVIKRDGRVAVFDKEKIKVAVQKAFEEVDGEVTAYARDKARDIASFIEGSKMAELTVEEIQDLVECKLMASNRKDVARAYILYRNERSKRREQNSKLMRDIKEKIEASNVENQNANVDERSFGGRMGAASSAVMKKYALDYCMSEMAKNNHLNNEIYIHDLDSYAIGMHNCYHAETQFVTSDGVKTFGECNENQKVKVIDINGEWRDAVVKKYGKQKMFDLTFRSSQTFKTVTCTRNHRWVLEDGSVTDNIQVGDSLWLTPEIKNDFVPNDKLWCFGFVLGDGCDVDMYSKDRTTITNHRMKVRLCGHKVEYLDKFLNCGWSLSEQHDNGDVVMNSRKGGAFKQSFMDSKMWRIMSHDDLCNIFEGYISADGHFTESGAVAISTSDERFRDFIEYASAVDGFYVWNSKIKHGDTNYKQDRTLYEYYLVPKQSTKWTLVDIKANRNGENGYQTAWCVEEPVTHTFTLQGCMVTGNCLSIPFDDLLERGFNTRQTDVRPAQSVSTAFQLVAVLFQLQSLQQFGKRLCRI